MVKLPYGGIEIVPKTADDDAWTRLATIVEYLEDGEAIPPSLACWLGEAIRHSNRNEKKFLINLGLAKPQGRQRKYIEDAWLKWGKMVCDLEDSGASPEEALSQVQKDMTENYDDEISRTALQVMRDKYRQAYEDSRFTTDKE